MKRTEHSAKKQQKRLQRPATVLLIAENYQQSKQVQSWVEEQLSKTVQTVTVAYTFEEALREFEFNHPDLILISACADEEKIFSFAKIVRDVNGNRHVGLMVYYLEEILEDEFVIRCLNAGVDDCIPSYVNPEVKAARVHAVIKLKRMTDELRHANYQLKKMSVTDDLTGLFNMRGFDKKLQQVVSECANRESALGMMMLDLDRFKSINDTMNHLVGSHVIEEIGKLIGQVAQGQNIYCARYGGDEFIVAMQLASAERCSVFSESLRKAIESKMFQYEDREFNVTASIGVCWVAKGYQGSSSALIKEADRMLYVSKEAGRNRVSLSQPSSLKKVS